MKSIHTQEKKGFIKMSDAELERVTGGGNGGSEGNEGNTCPKGLTKMAFPTCIGCPNFNGNTNNPKCSLNYTPYTVVKA